MKPDMSKLSPTDFPPGHPPIHPAHMDHGQHPLHDALAMKQHHHNMKHHQDAMDEVSTTSMSKRSGDDQRSGDRAYSPEEKSSDGEGVSKGSKDPDMSGFNRSVSSDDGIPSPDDPRMEGNFERNNGEDMMMGGDHEMQDENEFDDDLDDGPGGFNDERGYSGIRRFSDRGVMSRGSFPVRNRSRSFENDGEKEIRDYIKERNKGEEENSEGRNKRKKEMSENMDEDDQGKVFDGENNSSVKRRFAQRTGGSRLDKLAFLDHKDKKDGSIFNSIFPLKGNNGFNSNSNSNNNSNNNRNNSSSSNNDNNSADSLRPPKKHIERQNLNTRMIPSSSNRKQRHPMRRFSSAGSDMGEQQPQSTSSLPVTSTTAEAIERGDLTDTDLVSFLLTKGRVYKCVHCHMIFEDASLFLLHNGFHAHDEPFRCVVCNHTCKDRIDFNCHLTSHIK